MTDTIAPQPTTATPEQQITIDATNVLHGASDLGTDIRKEAERDTRHGLSYLEEEFLAECRKMATFSETESKKLLEWVASRLPGGASV